MTRLSFGMDCCANHSPPHTHTTLLFVRCHLTLGLAPMQSG